MKPRIDSTDVAALVGLGMVGAGLWWAWPPLALIVIGTVLVVTSAAAARQRRSR